MIRAHGEGGTVPLRSVIGQSSPGLASPRGAFAISSALFSSLAPTVT
jgi:hypothetical protein